MTLDAAICIATSLPACSSPPSISTSHADAAAVQVLRQRAPASQRGARSGGSTCSRRSSAPAPDARDSTVPSPERQRRQRRDVGRIFLGDELRQLARERDEVVVARDEIGLAVDLDACAPVLPSAAIMRADHAFRPRCDRRPSTPSRAALDAQQLLGLGQVAARLRSAPSLHSIMPRPVRWRSSITMLAVISAMLAQLHILLLVEPRAAQARRRDARHRGRRPLDAALSCRRFVRRKPRRIRRRLDDLLDRPGCCPSRIASATPRAYRRIARLESSLPGIT